MAVSGIVNAALHAQNYLYTMTKQRNETPQTTLTSGSLLRRFEAGFSDISRLRLLRHPFDYYAEGNTLVRMTSGVACGLTGYRIRISRDRCLVTCVGGLAVAISGIHKDMFTEIEGHK